VVGGCSIAALVGVVRRLAPPALDLQLGKTAVQGLINGGRRIGEYIRADDPGRSRRP